MKTQGWVLASVLLASTAFAGAECRPKDNRPLVIGHTYKLDWFTTFRLKNSARILGYKVVFKDLRLVQSDVEALRSIDALLVPGGADINPSYYTRPTLPTEILEKIQQYQSYYNASKEGEARDPHEYSLYLTYFGNAEFEKLPALGICRGMQMMAVSRGVPLVLDLKAEYGIKNRYNKFDRFHVNNSSVIMNELFPSGTNIGFKYHHQNPRIDYITAHENELSGLKVTATSHDGQIVEAIEFEGRPTLGIQFHPEKSLPKLKHKIFKWLLTNACEHSHQGETL